MSTPATYSITLSTGKSDNILLAFEYLRELVNSLL